MIRYYVEIEDNIMKNPATLYEEIQTVEVDGEIVQLTSPVEISHPFIEVSEEFYTEHKDELPATFSLDGKGNFVNIEPLPRPEPITPEPTLEEKLNLQIAQNTAETLELISTINEMQKLEQAQSNAEMIELILMLQGGM